MASSEQLETSLVEFSISTTDVLRTLIVNADLFLRETRKIDYVLPIGVDVQKINAGPKVLHQRAEGPGVDGPMVDSLILVKFGVHWSLGFKG